MTQTTAQLVGQMLETHTIKCREGLYGGRPSRGAGKLIEGGLLRDYLNENEGQGLVTGFDSALTWATPSSCRDRLLILNCAAAAELLPDDEPDHLSWRSIRSTEQSESVTLHRQPGSGFGFSLVTVGKGSVFVRRLQPFSAAEECGRVREGDKVLSVCGRSVGLGFGQKEIIQLMKCSDSVSLMLAHTNFDGKGCPETTLDRNSPLQSPALESSYRLAMDMSSSPSSSAYGGSGARHFRYNSSDGGTMSSEKRSHDQTSRILSGSLGDSLSTSSEAAEALTHSSGGSDPSKDPTSPALILSSPPPTRACPPAPRACPPAPRSLASSTMSRGSSVNRDFYRESLESLPNAATLGAVEYIVLPNQGKGIGIGISGRIGIIIRNILPGSIADKDGRLQIGDHILQVNNIKCTRMGQKDTKEVVIPELRSSTPTVRLLVQHAVLRTASRDSTPASTPSKSGAGATLPTQKHPENGLDLLLPEALWSDTHPTAPIAYRFGTVVLPAPSFVSWSKDTHFITLSRLSNGFGFSIMDYKEPKSPEPNSILIVRQITPFGAADLEGHLCLGERIVRVNGEPITQHSIEDIVTLIKPCNVLHLEMRRPVETGEWKALLSTNISAIPLVSGARTPKAQDTGISTSTLNVACRAPSPPPLIESPLVRPGSSGETLNITDHSSQSGERASKGSASRYEPTNLLSVSQMTGGRVQNEGSAGVDNHVARGRKLERISSPPTSAGDYPPVDNRSRARSYDRRGMSEYRDYTDYHQSRDYSRGYSPARTSSYYRQHDHEPRAATVRSPPRDSVRSPPRRQPQPELSRDSPDRFHYSTGREGGRQPRPPPDRKPSNTRVRSPDSRMGRYRRVTQGYSENQKTPQPPYRQPTVYKNDYETTFEARAPMKRSVSSGSGTGSEIQSIVSSVPGLNNEELTAMWRNRGNHHQQQLSRV